MPRKAYLLWLELRTDTTDGPRNLRDYLFDERKYNIFNYLDRVVELIGGSSPKDWGTSDTSGSERAPRCDQGNMGGKIPISTSISQLRSWLFSFPSRPPLIHFHQKVRLYRPDSQPLVPDQKKLSNGGRCSAIGTCMGVTYTRGLRVQYTAVSALHRFPLKDVQVHLNCAINVLSPWVGSYRCPGRWSPRSAATRCRTDHRVELRCSVW